MRKGDAKQISDALRVAGKASKGLSVGTGKNQTNIL